MTSDAKYSASEGSVLYVDVQSVRGQHGSQTSPLRRHPHSTPSHIHPRLLRPGEGQRWRWIEVDN